MEQYTIPRTGNAPLRFTGELSAETSGHESDGPANSRWHELAIYQTQAGKLVLVIAYESRWKGERGHSQATIHDTPAALAAALRAHNPTACVSGYPEGAQFAEKQRRLLADLTARFHAQVSEILDSDDFIETID